MGKTLFKDMKHTVYVTQEALPAARNYLRTNAIAYTVIPDSKALSDTAERAIVFDINKGKFLQPCPGTPKYICCGYYVLAPVENCPFACTYCILNAYFTNKHITVHVNTGAMIKELEHALRTKDIRRIGTGEFSDSMFLAATLFYLKPLLAVFKKHPDRYLELKTKSSFIPDIFKRTLYPNVIFSWSLNSPEITKKEEGGTASILERLKAAKEMVKLGYRVSFHFDPIIEHPRWENGYRRTIQEIFRHVPAESIVWISLGTLRFMPLLKDIATGMYPRTRIFDHEFIRGLDGKKRYLRSDRTHIYKTILGMIRKHAPDVFVYLCMENEDVWQDVFGVKMTTRKLKELMDEQLERTQQRQGSRSKGNEKK